MRDSDIWLHIFPGHSSWPILSFLSLPLPALVISSLFRCSSSVRLASHVWNCYTYINENKCASHSTEKNKTSLEKIRKNEKCSGIKSNKITSTQRQEATSDKSSNHFSMRIIFPFFSVFFASTVVYLYPAHTSHIDAQSSEIMIAVWCGLSRAPRWNRLSPSAIVRLTSIEFLIAKADAMWTEQEEAGLEKGDNWMQPMFFEIIGNNSNWVDFP